MRMGILAAALAALVPVPAVAASFMFTVSGTASGQSKSVLEYADGIDDLPYDGTGNVYDFVDTPFEIRAIYDFSEPLEVINGSQSRMFGETYTFDLSPFPFNEPLASRLDGQEVAVGFVHDLAATKTNDAAGDSLAFQVSHFRVGGGSQSGMGFTARFAAPAGLFKRTSFLESFTFTAPAGSTASLTGGYSNYSFDEDFGVGYRTTTTDFTATGPITFKIEAVGEPGMVPEPATWALMLAGFGLVGSALRRRQPDCPVAA